MRDVLLVVSAIAIGACALVVDVVMAWDFLATHSCAHNAFCERMRHTHRDATLDEQIIVAVTSWFVVPAILVACLRRLRQER